MALNSSGPLSFGGSTVGQSINLELGVSATAQASINATDFRALAGVPSGQISVNDFYGKSSATFYFVHIPGNNFGGGGPGESNITKDSSDNFYVNVGLTGSRGTLIKFNSSFTYVTNVYWTNVFSYMYNPTAIGSQVLIPGSFSRQISFFDNSLANTINRNTTDYYGSVSDIYAGCTDGTYLYIAARQDYNTAIVKWSVGTNSLTRVWGINDTTNSTASTGTPRGIVANASGETLTISTDPGASYTINLIKTNSSGSVVYTKQFDAASGIKGEGQGSGIGLDSSGNAYLMTGSPTNSSQVVTKLDTSGNVLWASAVSNACELGSGNAVQGVCDPSGNTYTVSTFYNGSTYVAYMVKRNSSGTVQWQKAITPSAYRFEPTNDYSLNSMMIVTGGFAWTCCYRFSPNNATSTILTYPADGSKDGTFSAGGLSLYVSASSNAVTSLTVTSTNKTTAFTSISATTSTGSDTYWTGTNSMSTPTSASVI
jgi:hypothetical protein